MKLSNHYRDQLDALSDILYARARFIHSIPSTHNFEMAEACRAYARDYALSQRLLKSFAAEQALEEESR